MTSSDGFENHSLPTCFLMFCLFVFNLEVFFQDWANKRRQNVGLEWQALGLFLFALGIRMRRGEFYGDTQCNGPVETEAERGFFTVIQLGTEEVKLKLCACQSFVPSGFLPLSLMWFVIFVALLFFVWMAFIFVVVGHHASVGKAAYTDQGICSVTRLAFPFPVAQPKEETPLSLWATRMLVDAVLWWPLVGMTTARTVWRAYASFAEVAFRLGLFLKHPDYLLGPSNGNP